MSPVNETARPCLSLASEQVLPEGRKMVRIERSKIKVGSNIREKYPEDSLRELSESLKLHGQLQPCLVLPDLTLYAGFRRFFALEMAGIDDIWVIITERILTETERMLAQLSENWHRRGAFLGFLDVGKIQRYDGAKGVLVPGLGCMGQFHDLPELIQRSGEEGRTGGAIVRAGGQAVLVALVMGKIGSPCLIIPDAALTALHGELPEGTEWIEPPSGYCNSVRISVQLPARVLCYHRHKYLYENQLRS